MLGGVLPSIHKAGLVTRTKEKISPIRTLHRWLLVSPVVARGKSAGQIIVSLEYWETFDYQKTNKQKNLWELVGGKERDLMCTHGEMRAPCLNSVSLGGSVL